MINGLPSFNSILRGLGPAISNKISTLTSQVSESLNLLKQITSGFDRSSVSSNNGVSSNLSNPLNALTKFMPGLQLLGLLSLPNLLKDQLGKLTSRGLENGQEVTPQNLGERDFGSELSSVSDLVQQVLGKIPADLDGDGKISGEELAALPGLLARIRREVGGLQNQAGALEGGQLAALAKKIDSSVDNLSGGRGDGLASIEEIQAFIQRHQALKAQNPASAAGEDALIRLAQTLLARTGGASVLPGGTAAAAGAATGIPQIPGATTNAAGQTVFTLPPGVNIPAIPGSVAAAVNAATGGAGNPVTPVGGSVNDIIRSGLSANNAGFTADQQTMLDNVTDPKQKAMMAAQFRMQNMQETCAFISNMMKKDNEIKMSLINNLR